MSSSNTIGDESCSLNTIVLHGPARAGVWWNNSVDVNHPKNRTIGIKRSTSVQTPTRHINREDFSMKVSQEMNNELKIMKIKK